ncbi:TPA_asm: hypothetical protein GNB54_002820 [Salmonella enterica subsp. enterica serovar Paratyphi C]|uniref:Uncharacterized protein n=3 Tax=Salmonella enterica TaxID=28901 RepID=A0A754D8X0_SALER|nr:hypothetical protein [Salmonella enterica]QUZ46015.1 hypothetical protein JYM88_00465 [Salmonella enterica subsp. enterica serovar Paratyphi B str. CFSAN000549]HAB6613871.1 hypothetical protein [Salmonella enterica subsp. enterica serovar Paratyphi C]HAE8362550.1 hypothetical protein [Salmonella enterica subsp. enterica serovar Paratyphi B]HAE8318200.1 hypothetical protein [Salmonella enterica subsp. enterica serovar Paratyphi C]HAF8516980.1 hypothetical protein [Salmonella enterica]
MLNDEHEGKPVINLIMKVSDEDWNVPVGQIAKSSMPLSRYLEYTNDRLSIIYRELNKTVLDKLKLIPCLLMTEFVNEQNLEGRSRLVSNIRVGMLESVTVNGKNLEYAVRIDYDYEKVTVDNFRVLGDRFFFHLFETSRTHWAIKEVSLPEVMNAFGLRLPIPPSAAAAARIV